MAMLARHLFAILILLVLLIPVIARDNGQWSGKAVERRQWFRSQVSPKTGMVCCSEADGSEAQEQIKNGHYWVTWPAVSPRWYEVPDDVVIRDPGNGHPGHPVVWIYYEQGELKIRCYSPGALL